MSQKWRELFGHEEFEWISKLGASYTDPEQKKAFWETLRDKKTQDPHYSVFTDFPREPLTGGAKVCSEVIEMLKRGIKKEGKSA